MSYILDALRKADAQRERDPARGIHAQPLHATSERRLRSGYAPWVWGAGVLGVAAAAGAGWLVYQDRTAVAAAPPRSSRGCRAGRDIGRGSSAGSRRGDGGAAASRRPRDNPVSPRGLRMTAQPMGGCSPIGW